VSAAASGRTILDRPEAFILENPSFAVRLAVETANRHGPSLLTGFVAACLLQISKIATILRQTANRNDDERAEPSRLLRGLDGVAIAAARHQAILHLARGREVAGEPDPDGQQHNGDHQADDRAAPVIAVAMFGICHRAAICGRMIRKTMQRFSGVDARKLEARRF
jgi:hypothetical protein